MNVDQMVKGVHDSLAVKRVYGDPIERDGAVVVPAAVASGASCSLVGVRSSGGAAGFGAAVSVCRVRSVVSLVSAGLGAFAARGVSFPARGFFLRVCTQPPPDADAPRTNGISRNLASAYFE